MYNLQNKSSPSVRQPKSTCVLRVTHSSHSGSPKIHVVCPRECYGLVCKKESTKCIHFFFFQVLSSFLREQKQARENKAPLTLSYLGGPKTYF